VVGSGTEGKLANFPGWIYIIEGLYMDLGHLDASGPGGSVTVVPGGPGADPHCDLGAISHTHPFHRHHPSRRAELSIPLI
jgi:hypothetical protein